MLKSLLRIILIGTSVYFGVKNRYRLLNVALSNGFLRKMMVSSSLNMPGVREKMIQGMFGKPTTGRTE
ncbi:hypothetical protein [Peribacillus sp. SCS-155]|uniref:hypothetical protein n=1 Tax=Peribacillus sedimenti TaxID=3115297 RepID=UPI0039066139